MWDGWGVGGALVRFVVSMWWTWWGGLVTTKGRKRTKGNGSHRFAWLDTVGGRFWVGRGWAREAHETREKHEVGCGLGFFRWRRVRIRATRIRPKARVNRIRWRARGRAGSACQGSFVSRGTRLTRSVRTLAHPAREAAGPPGERVRTKRDTAPPRCRGSFSPFALSKVEGRSQDIARFRPKAFGVRGTTGAENVAHLVTDGIGRSAGASTV